MGNDELSPPRSGRSLRVVSDVSAHRTGSPVDLTPMLSQEVADPLRPLLANRRLDGNAYYVVSLLSGSSDADLLSRIERELQLAGYTAVAGTVPEGLAFVITSHAKDALLVRGGHDVVVSAASGTSPVVSGHALPGIGQVQTSYEQAREVLSFVREQPLLEYQSLAFHDYLTYLLVQAPALELITRIVDLALSPLTHQLNADALLETVETFFAGTTLEQAARALGIRPQSMSDRMARVHQITGVSLRERSGQILYQLALRSQHVKI